MIAANNSIVQRSFKKNCYYDKWLCYSVAMAMEEGHQGVVDGGAMGHYALQ